MFVKNRWAVVHVYLFTYLLVIRNCSFKYVVLPKFLVHCSHFSEWFSHSLVVHGAMGCGQWSFKLVWRCHQLLSGFLAKGHLPRVSSQSRRWTETLVSCACVVSCIWGLAYLIVPLFIYTFKTHVLNTNGKVEILKYNYLYGFFPPSSHSKKYITIPS